MIFNYMYGTNFVNPYVDLSNIYGYGDGYFPERHGMLGRPNMRGQLLGDKLELTTQKEKDKRGWKKFLKLTAAVVGAVIGYKVLKGPVTRLGGAIKNLFKRTPTPTP
ncbi:hypothetical protein IKL64_01685 [bacterium]|nr:hypothetical protein [bacterium]